MIKKNFSKFEKLDLSNDGKTPFLQTPISQLYQSVLFLIKNKYIDIKLTFIDLGSGIGGVPLTVSGVFEIPSLGIEFSPKLYEISKKIKSELERDGLELEMVELINGDYRDLSFYKNKDIGVLFNYYSSNISSILEYVKPGTILLSYLIGGRRLNLHNTSHFRRILRKNSYFNSLKFNDKKSLIDNLIQKKGSWKYIQKIPKTMVHMWIKS